MNNQNRFEEHIAWQKARELCKLVASLTKKDLFSKDLKLSSQVRDSSGAIMDKVAEGIEEHEEKDSAKCFRRAQNACVSLRSQLHRASDLNYINKGDFEHTYNLAEDVAKLIREELQNMPKESIV